MFRILTSAQYDAICDIVTEKDRVIETQKAIIADLREENRLLNENIKAISDSYTELQSAYVNKCQILNCYRFHYGMNIDFPATTKQPEDKLF